MKIYPKTSRNFEGLDKMEKYVKKYKGVELQYFDENGIMAEFDLKTPVEKLMEMYPYIEEVTIHPPLSFYDIECIMLKDINIIKKQLKDVVMLSRKYNIHINLLYHTEWGYKKHFEATIDKFKEILTIIEGENVYLILENIYMFFEDKCSVFEVANRINHPNLKVCFDICHLYCRANIERTNVEEYASRYLDPNLCKKYIHQVHFSDTLDNDGYIKRSTHGKLHRNIEQLKFDLNLLKKYNMYECNYITEISEEDYSARVDQLKELEMLEQVVNNKEE